MAVTIDRHNAPWYNANQLRGSEAERHWGWRSNGVVMPEIASLKKETIQILVSELVEVFENEAHLVCKDEKTANILAILSLVHFIDRYGRDVVIG